MSQIWLVTNSCSYRRLFPRGIRPGVRCASRLLRSAAVAACFVLSTVAARAQNKVEMPSAPGRGAASAKSGDANAAGPESSGYPDAAPPGPSLQSQSQSEAAAEVAYQQAQVRYAQHDVKG